MLAAFIALAISVTCLALLCAGDPKRLRASGMLHAGHGAGTRRSLIMGAVLPGLALAIVGDTAALFAWIGGCAVAGWLLTQYFARHTLR